MQLVDSKISCIQRFISLSDGRERHIVTTCEKTVEDDAIAVLVKMGETTKKAKALLEQAKRERPTPQKTCLRQR